MDPRFRGEDRRTGIGDWFMRKILITLGIVLIVAGLLWPFVAKLGLGRLPGDIVVSIVLTLIFRFWGK